LECKTTPALQIIDHLFYIEMLLVVCQQIRVLSGLARALL